MFREAAALLQGEAVPAECESKARELIVRMGFGHVLGADGSWNSGKAEAAAFFNAAARMTRIFSLRSPDAPGLACVDGTVDPGAYGLAGFSTADVSGRGLDRQQAFKSCIGEGVEYLSQLEWGDEAFACGDGDARSGPFDAFLSRPGAPASATSLLPGRSLLTGLRAGVPVELCLRREHRSNHGTQVSRTGCAAGETQTHATIAALLELVERDAAALWWVGGRRGRALADEVLASGGIAPLLGKLREGSRFRRRTWLLDITTDLDIPSAAAISVDSAGRGLTCGLAARLTLADAARSAVQELCQMEIVHHLIAIKLAHGGEAALTETDRRHQRRLTGINAAQCQLLFPDATPRTPAGFASDAPGAQLQWLVAHLARKGVESFVVDLTRPAIGIAAVRVLAPGLQALPSLIATKRLQRVIARTGGGYKHVGGIDLL